MIALQARSTGEPPAWRHARALRAAPAFALLLVSVGCAELERAATETARIERSSSFSVASRSQREVEMNREWQNRPLAELVEVVGEPQLTMNIPGGGNPPGFVVVYGLDTRSGCIDAFAISAGGTRQPTVRIYHCR